MLSKLQKFFPTATAHTKTCNNTVAFNTVPFSAFKNTIQKRNNSDGSGPKPRLPRTIEELTRFSYNRIPMGNSTVAQNFPAQQWETKLELLHRAQKRQFFLLVTILGLGVCAAYYGWGGDYQPHWIDTVDQTPGIRVARMMHLEEEAKELAMNRTSAELEERKKRKQEELEMREKKSSAESFEAKLAKQEQALRDLKK